MISYTLREHQQHAVRWLLAHPRGYLGDAPRVGKTRPLLVAAAAALPNQRTLVACPASLRTHWQREYEALRLSNPISIKSYDELARGGDALQATLQGGYIPVKGLIMDEAHYLKHAAAERTRRLLGRSGYARELEYVWPASGTPVPKHPGEYGTILLSLFPELALRHGIKSLAQFRDRFLVTQMVRRRGVWEPKVVGTRNDDEFRELIDATMLRRTLSDLGSDVPTLDWQLTRLETVDGHVPDFGWAHFSNEDLARLSEIAGEPDMSRLRRRIGEFKCVKVAEYLTDALAESQESLVVFAHHKNVLSYLRGALASFGVAYLDGDSSDAQKQEAVDSFQSGEKRVCLGQNQVMAEGHTLHRANRCVIVEPSWSAYQNVQMANRVVDASKPGRRCVVELVALAGTLDEAIVAQNKRESETMERLELGD